jgi:hypothetical protein
MITVYKYPFPIEGAFELELPRGARILAVQMQRGTPNFWALVDPAAPTERRAFRLFGTGHPIEPRPGLLMEGHYLGTIQDEGFVWHVFEDFGG